MNKKSALFITLFLLLNVYAFCELSIKTGGPMTTANYGDPAINAEINTMMNSIIYDYSSGLNGFSVFVSDSFNLANVNSVPIGENKLDNITFGFSINFSGSVDNPKNPFDTSGGSSAAPLPKVGAGINVSLFAGLSLGKRFDILFSFMYIKDDWAEAGLNSVAEMFGSSVNGFSISFLSMGTKVRYTLTSKSVSESTGFAGLTISPGFYFAYAPIKYNKNGLGLSADYNTGIPVPPAPAGADKGKFKIQGLDFSSTLYVIVIDLEITFYIKLIKVFNLYFGAGGSLSFSHFVIDSKIDCENEVNSNSFDGYVSITGKEFGSTILPRAFAGLEINLFVRMGFQFTISWTKGQALYGATFAMRVGF